MKQEFLNFKINTDGQKLYEFTNATIDWVKKKKFKEQKFTDNSVLNKILNETAQQKEEYPTLGGGTFDSSRMTEMLGYGGGLGNKEVKREVAAASTLQSAGMNPDDAPEHLKNALTRDYSGLIKAIDKKKGK